MAVEDPYSYASAAAILGISADILENYLNNPEYVLTSEVYNAILTNLPLLPFNSHERQTTDNWVITFLEKPQWTEADVAGLVPPVGASQAVIFAYEGEYDTGVSANGPADLDMFSVQQDIDAATNGDVSRVLTVVWYEHRE